MPQRADDQLVLPLGTRLLHIGPMKTGTTSLQQMLFRQRDHLRRIGVLYPGKYKNHRWAIGAFMGARVIGVNRRKIVGGGPVRGQNDPAVPSMDEWESLISELAAGGWDRSVISHEVAAQADVDAAKRLVDAFGEPTHVVVTLRKLESVLPSLWTERLKAGITEPFDDWLERAIGCNTEKRLHVELERHLDHGGLVERWASAAGPENVTVVIADSANPTVIPNAFETLLDLPRGLLSSESLDGFMSNRSLRAAEAEVLRQINEVSKKHSVAWDSYFRLIQRGVVRRWRQVRLPQLNEPRVVLPRWAAAKSHELSTCHADQIRNSGVRIIGDLESLTHSNTAIEDDNVGLTDIPIDVAVEALSGILSASLNRGALFTKPRKGTEFARRQEDACYASGKRGRPGIQNLSAETIADSYSTKDIIDALEIRVRRKLQVKGSQIVKAWGAVQRNRS